MTLLEGQANVKPQTPMPVERIDDSCVVTAVSGETFVWYYLNSTVWAAGVGQAAKTIVWGKTTYDNILNSSASAIGSYNDTSVSFAAADRAATKVSIPEEVFSAMVTMSPADQKATITPYLATAGDYAIDHRRGMVWLNSKATVANDSISYSYRTPTTGGSAGDKVDIIKINGDAVAAANTARTTATKVIPTQNIGADGTVPPTGSLLTNAPFAKITDGTSNLTLGTGTTKTVPAELNDGTTKIVFGTGTTKNVPVGLNDGTTAITFGTGTQKTVPTAISDGTSEVDVIATINSMKTDLSSVAGTATVTAGVNGLQAIGGNTAHDGIDAGNPIKIGFKAVDPTSLPADVSASDRVDAIGSLKGETLVYNTRLGAGEDQTNNITAVVVKPIAVNTYALSTDIPAALEASTVTKASAGNVYVCRGRLDSTAASGTYYIQLLNASSLPADGAVTHLKAPFKIIHTTGTDSFWDFEINCNYPVYASTGIVVCLSSTEFTKTIGGSYLSTNVSYL